MADQDEILQEGQDRTSRRKYQQFPQRSVASNNWRTKDETPRADPQPRRANRQSGSFGTPRQDPELGQSRDANETRLYVGNLLYSAQRDDIAQFFSDNGFNILNLSMSIDPMTGRNPSYCFADFESPEEASRAMSELNGKDILGRAVRINPGVTKRYDGQGPSGGLRTNSYGRGWKTDPPQGKKPRIIVLRSSETDWEADNYKPTFDRWNRNDAPSHWNTKGESHENQGPSKRLYVGNLPRMEPQSAVDAAIQGLFDPLGIEITAVSKIISPHESKKDLAGDHYFLFVDLARAEDADIAIEALDGKPTSWSGDNGLRVNRAREQGGRKVAREQTQGGYQSRRNDGPREWRNQGQDHEQ